MLHLTEEVFLIKLVLEHLGDSDCEIILSCVFLN